MWGHSGTVASRWPLESSVCETIPTLAALAQARSCKRLPRAFPASSKSPCPHPVMVARLVIPTLWRWRQKDQFKAHCGYKRTISKKTLVLFAVGQASDSVPSKSLTLPSAAVSLGSVSTYTTREEPVSPP